VAVLRAYTALDIPGTLGSSGGEGTVTRTPTLITVTTTFVTIRAYGSFAPGPTPSDPWTGTISSLKFTKLGSAWFDVDGLALPLSELDDYATGEALIASVMGGSDTIIGSAANDSLLAWDGDDSLFGGNGADKLQGNSGNDYIVGGSGVDSLAGGWGDDTFVVDTAADVVIEAAGQGYDRVRAGLSFTLANNVEALELTGSAAINGYGNALDNLLLGNGANNTLDGRAGADTMIGGSGNDIYYADNPGDTIVEAPGGGLDTVRALANGVSLGANAEVLQLMGSVLWGNGSSTGDSLYGNASANTLFGGSGADLLNGGSGGDSLYGGSGDDTFVVDTGTDRAFGGEGSDTVRTTANTTLGGGIENLVLLGTALYGIGDASANAITGNASANTLLGNSGNDTLNGGSGIDSLYGGSGDDLYLVDTATEKVADIAGGGYDTVQASLSFTLGAEIEALILGGTAAVSGFGNAAGNYLQGNGANNTLDGKAGADTLAGGSGNDIYYADNLGDTIVEAPGGGQDILRAQVNGLSLFPNVEVLQLLPGVLWGSGSSGSESLYGNAGVNTLFGGSGADLLDGGSGGDSLYGGSGNDTFVIDTATDRAFGGDGSDTVRTTASTVLGGGIENLVLLGTALYGIGDADANAITGNALANTLVGNSGNDTLNGGSGIDSLYGGSGDDLYLVDTATEKVADIAGGGYDTVQASLNFTLGAEIEALLLGGTAAISGFGNAVDNYLQGNGANNTLDGRSGADTLAGGSGNDIYYADDLGDTIVEAPGGGQDILRAQINGLSLFTGVEVLQLLPGVLWGSGSSGSESLYGNAGVNTLFGGSGADLLDGGSGGDTLIGGSGDDTYNVDTATDTISDSGGIDTVRAAANTVLAAGLENLVLLGAAKIGQGNAADNLLTGNNQANTLSGLSGADSLNGGSGIDTLIGGSGNDSYFVDTATDRIIEAAGGGLDTVLSLAATYSLAAEVENLALAGSAVRGIGNSLDNTITGTGRTNSLSGGSGNDWLIGGSGSDSLIGGYGNDTLGVDTSSDKIFESAGQGYDFAVASSSYVLGANVEGLQLTGGASLKGTGNVLANALFGNDGANSLAGLDGNDTLYGGLGNDSLIGGSGNDLLWGGAGQDTLFGGVGADTFFFTTASDSPSGASDFIADLQANDRLDLSAIDADTTLDDDQAFTYIGNAAFGGAGQLRMNGTVLEGDTDGDGVADLMIRTTTANPIWSFNF